MAGLETLGLGRQVLRRRDGAWIEHVQTRQPLRRVLAFTRRSIDDVVNDPIARNEVLGYYKLYRQVQSRSEALELERQWNPNGERGA